MKKVFAFILAVVMCLSLCACGGAKEYTSDEVKQEAATFMVEYIHSLYDHSDLIKGDAEIEFERITEIKENQWMVLGTATVVTANGNYTFDAAFGVVATYEEDEGGLVFSKVELDDFD